MDNQVTVNPANASVNPAEAEKPKLPERKHAGADIELMLINAKNTLTKQLLNEKIYQRQVLALPNDEDVKKELAAIQRGIKIYRSTIEVLEEIKEDEANNDGEITKAVWGDTV